MGHQNFSVLSIAPDQAVQVGALSAAGSVAIPTTANGSLPKYVYCVAYGADLAETVFITPQIGAGNGTAATGFALPVRNSSSVVLNVSGYTYIGYDISSGATSAYLTIVALEDF